MNADKRSSYWEERRRHKRFFLKSNAYEAIVRTGQPDGPPCTARLLNVSSGGVGLAIPRNTDFPIRSGQRLWLQELKRIDENGPRQWRPVESCSLKVCWLVDGPGLDHLGFGCAFEGPSTSIFGDLASFLDLTMQT